MSRLFRDRLIVGLEPATVSWVRRAGGFDKRIIARYSGAADPAFGNEPWAGAVETLRESLASLEGARIDVTVVLSNHFVRYAIVPPAAARAHEELALARFHFAKVHGERAAAWDVRLAPADADAPRLASAIDAKLLDALKACFPRRGRARLVSVQPYLMSAFNAWRDRVPEDGAWLLLVEPERACLALVTGARWHSVQTLRSAYAAPEHWPALLAREKLRASAEDVPATVLTRSRVPAPQALSGDGDWRFVMLEPPPLPGASAEAREHFSLALSAA